jgi:adenylate cyclase
MRELGPTLGPSLVHMLGLRLREQIRQAVVGSAELESGRLPGAQPVAVCFADIVGFTSLGEQIPVAELGSIVGHLEALAGDVAAPPVRLVKTIGDAAMLVAPDSAALLDAALALVEAADSDDGFPRLRAGVACGEALTKGGDWYGHPVNLASRITGVARPSSVLVAKGVRDAVGDGYAFSFAGKRRLKGVGEVPLFRARAAVSEDGGDG